MPVVIDPIMNEGKQNTKKKKKYVQVSEYGDISRYPQTPWYETNGMES